MRSPVINSSGEQATFLRCRQKWLWGAVMNLTPKGRGRPALIFGDLWHRTMERFYKPGRKRGPKPWKTFEKLYMEFVDIHGKVKIRDLEGEDDDLYDMGEMGMELCRMYYDHYGDDEDIEVISPEFPFYVRLKDLGGKPFYVVGRMDACIIYRPTSEVAIFEHKTGSEKKKQHLMLDEQGGRYWTFGPKFLKKAGIIDRVADVDMMLYNFARKGKRDDRPENEQGQKLNKDGTVSKRQPVPMFERIPVYRGGDDRVEITERIRAIAQDMRLAREGKIPIYKNPTDDCSWDCSFADMCELHETKADYTAYMEQMYVRGEGVDGRYKDVLAMIRKHGKEVSALGKV